jgi:hypothetical protein
MLLSGVLFVLFLAGCWLYCLTDAALTPAAAFPGWRKRTWIVVIALTLVAGAIAWMIARRNWRSQQSSAADTANLMIIDRSGGNVLWYPYAPTEPGEPRGWGLPTESDADAALFRHPAGRSRASRRGRERDRSGWTAPRGPDDDPEFIRQLAHRIHGTPTDPAE